MSVDSIVARPRPLVESDIAAASALLVSAYPHRWHEPSHWGNRHPNDSLRWVVDAPQASASASASASRALAAYLALWRVDALEYRMDVIVDEPWRRRGLGSRLIDFLITQAKLAHATSLQARSYAESADALALLDTRGFRETMRMTGLELDDVAATAVGALDGLRKALEGRGLAIATFAEALAARPDAWVQLHAANQAARFDWPEPDPRPDGQPRAPETVEEFRVRTEQFRMIPQACFVATAGEDFVGYSALTSVDAEGVEAGSGGTAVRPEFRGVGVATALKACCVAWARDHGVRRLATSSGNPAMIRVNEKFGFRGTYTELRLVRRFWQEQPGIVRLTD